MSSTPGSTTQSGSRVRRAAVVTHGKPDTIGPALGRLEALAGEHGVELLFPEEEREKHHLASADGDPKSADLAVVLGGLPILFLAWRVASRRAAQEPKVSR